MCLPAGSFPPDTHPRIETDADSMRARSRQKAIDRFF
jgi:hypothetical protein